MANSSNKVKTESIDEVILRLLGLKSGTEIDSQTYFKILRNKLASPRLVGKQLPEEEDKLLRDELKRVRKFKDKEITLKLKSVKSKDITGGVRNFNLNQKRIRPSSGAIVRYKGDNQLYRSISETKEPTEERKESGFFTIRKTLSSILETLAQKINFEQKQSETERKNKEKEKRENRESTLEGFTKGIAGIVATAKKTLSPFQNIIERIKKFLFFTILGRAFTAFMDWMKDKENQKKFNSLIEFLTKHWPAIAGLYILFGTSFGALIRGLLKGAVRMTIALAANIPRIISFIKKNKALSMIALSAAPFVIREVSNIFNKKDETSGLIPSKNKDLDEAKNKTEQAKNTRVPTFNLGGLVPGFAMGGINMGGMGLDFSSGIPISGAGQDDTLIAAKTGEAILTEKDQRDINQRYVDRRTGQPLNIPQYLSGRTPGYVNMGNLSFGGMGKGFYKGGILSKFNTGGIVGGSPIQLPNLAKTNNQTPQMGGGLLQQGSKMLQNTMGFLNKFLPFGSSSPTPKRKPKPLQEFQQPEARSLLSTIRSAEHYKGVNPYTAIYGGKSAPVTKMTIQEVIDMGNTGNLPKRFGGKSAGYGSGSTATGAYQFMPFTLEDLIRRGVAKPNEIMSPSVQDRLGWELAKNRGVTLGSLKKTGMSQSIMDMMAPEWASFPYSLSGGKSYYGQPVKGADFLKGIYQQSLNRIRPPKKEKGGFTGLIGESTGRNISGATADRQLVATQPGEYVLPKRTVATLGVPLIEKMVAMTDSNSDAYLKSGNRNFPKITPYGSSMNRNSIMTLPPIVQGQGGSRARASGYSGGSKVPSFSNVSDISDRNIIAQIYGIEESTSMV